jgi:ABC-type transport system substrate-binding protein
MNIQAVEWAAMQKKMDDKEFDCYTGGWGLVWDPDPYQIWHSSQADVPKGSNRVGFRSKEADAIIEELRRTFDREKRIELCRRFHRILHEEQPYTFFWARQYVAVWWDHVKHTEFSIDRPHAYSMPWYSVR